MRPRAGFDFPARRGARPRRSRRGTRRILRILAVGHHRAHPAVAAHRGGFAQAGHAQADGAVGAVVRAFVRRRRAASPAVAAQHATVGDQVVRRGVGDHRRDDVAGPDARRRRERSAPAGRRGPGRSSARSRCPCGPPPPRPALRRCGRAVRGSPPAKSLPGARSAARYRCCTTSLGSWSGSSAAGVPGRLEYWKVNAPANLRGPHHVEGGLEVLFGLAGEADDDVGGDRRVRHRGAHPVDDAAGNARHGRTAASPCSIRSDPDCSGMCSAGHTFGCRRHRLDDVVGELGGVRRGEPHPLQAVDAARRRAAVTAKAPRSRGVSGSANDTP